VGHAVARLKFERLLAGFLRLLEPLEPPEGPGFEKTGPGVARQALDDGTRDVESATGPVGVEQQETQGEATQIEVRIVAIELFEFGDCRLALPADGPGQRDVVSQDVVASEVRGRRRRQIDHAAEIMQLKCHRDGGTQLAGLLDSLQTSFPRQARWRPGSAGSTGEMENRLANLPVERAA